MSAKNLVLPAGSSPLENLSSFADTRRQAFRLTLDVNRSGRFRTSIVQPLRPSSNLSNLRSTLQIRLGQISAIYRFSARALRTLSFYYYMVDRLETLSQAVIVVMSIDYGDRDIDTFSTTLDTLETLLFYQ